VTTPQRTITNMMRPRTIRIVALMLVIMVCLTFVTRWDTVLAQDVWSDWLCRSALHVSTLDW